MRCQMICVDQYDGSTNPDILRCLMANRGSKVRKPIIIIRVTVRGHLASQTCYCGHSEIRAPL